MLITVNDLNEEILNKKELNSEYYQLIHGLQSMAMELETHKKRVIKLSSYSDFFNEEKYTLIDYKIYRVLDSRNKNEKEYSFTLIITVEDAVKEQLSFCYDHIIHIDDKLINSTTLKFWIRVRNRIFDDPSYNEGGFSLSDQEKEFIDKHKYSTYRFFLYD